MADAVPPSGAQMPLVGNKLDAAQLQTILNWIEEGAQDNDGGRAEPLREPGHGLVRVRLPDHQCPLDHVHGTTKDVVTRLPGGQVDGCLPAHGQGGPALEEARELNLRGARIVGLAQENQAHGLARASRESIGNEAGGRHPDAQDLGPLGGLNGSL